MSRCLRELLASRQGFTLVEAVVVMAILSVVTMAIMSFIIPTQRSMKKQEQVTDVQDNLSLAVDVMTRDLLAAGFLVDPAFDPPTTHANCPSYWKGDDPAADMQPGPIFWQGNDNTEDVDDLTIRTRLVGKSFAVMGGDMRSATVSPTDAEMLAHFCACKDDPDEDEAKFDGLWDVCSMRSPAPKVRVFNPISMTDPDCMPGDYDCELVPATVAASLRSVTGCSAGSRTNRNDDSFTLDGAVDPRAVIVVTGENALPMQTIRYRVANGALERIINGNPQILARGVTAVNFTYGRSSAGAVNRVDVTLTGVFEAANPAGGGMTQTSRSITTLVNLRNVY